jgi:hypothetical protein
MKARALLNVSAMTLAMACALVAAACNRSSSFSAPKADAAGPSADPGYRAPPQLRSWEAAGDGAVSLRGRAWPSSRVRIISPAGLELHTTADGSGGWTLPLGPVSEPSLYRLAEEYRPTGESQDRRIDAEGLVLVLPGPPVVALLRAGSGAEVVDGGRGGPLKILAVDYDGGGGAVVSGRAAAAATVRLQVDGQPAGEGAAGPDGRFSLVLAKPLGTGAHQLRAQTSRGEATASVQITPPDPPTDSPYRVRSQPSGWRIDWVTVGEGFQTTLLMGG